MKTPNTQTKHWKVVTYHAGEILDTRYFDTAEEAMGFSHDLSELLETSTLDGMKMHCEWMLSNPRPAEVLLDWL
jgi:hypothetical protein